LYTKHIYYNTWYSKSYTRRSSIKYKKYIYSFVELYNGCACNVYTVYSYGVIIVVVDIDATVVVVVDAAAAAVRAWLSLPKSTSIHPARCTFPVTFNRDSDRAALRRFFAKPRLVGRRVGTDDADDRRARVWGEVFAEGWRRSPDCRAPLLCVLSTPYTFI